jgi:23S rRNA (cytidine1920-2'-O)/16S rRNA (cytidine1409-2'-O)-methyltransferase
MEGVNIRGVAKDLLPDPIDFACIDTSFISLKLVLEPAAQFVKVGGSIVALIKPQHEVGKDKVGKGGIVRDEELHREVTDAISAYAQLIGLVVGGLVESPIRGTTGNKEFLICLRK